MSNHACGLLSRTERSVVKEPINQGILRSGNFAQNDTKLRVYGQTLINPSEKCGDGTNKNLTALILNHHDCNNSY